jgi:hypothetical protein
LTLTVTMDQKASGVSEEPSDHADARIRGDSRAWVSAFSPGGSMSSLQISGDGAMAEQMIRRLARSDMQARDGIDRAVA